MRIKLFESFKKQYEEIAQDEFCIIVYGTSDLPSLEDKGNFLHLTAYEKKMVESFFPNHSVLYGSSRDHADFEVWKGSCIIPNFLYRKAIYIDKFDDDWFLVEVPKDVRRNVTNTEEKYFKCDQFEGLLELLRDITGFDPTNRA